MRRPIGRPRLTLTVQRAVLADWLPGDRRLREWAGLASLEDAHVTLRLIGQEEARELNRAYRGRNYATNVLAFPYADLVETSRRRGRTEISNSIPNTAAIRTSVDSCGSVAAFSILSTVCRWTPATSAVVSWVQPARSRIAPRSCESLTASRSTAAAISGSSTRR